MLTLLLPSRESLSLKVGLDDDWPSGARLRISTSWRGIQEDIASFKAFFDLKHSTVNLIHTHLQMYNHYIHCIDCLPFKTWLNYHNLFQREENNLQSDGTLQYGTLLISQQPQLIFFPLFNVSTSPMSFIGYITLV